MEKNIKSLRAVALGAVAAAIVCVFALEFCKKDKQDKKNPQTQNKAGGTNTTVGGGVVSFPKFPTGKAIDKPLGLALETTASISVNPSDPSKRDVKIKLTAHGNSDGQKLANSYNKDLKIWLFDQAVPTLGVDNGKFPESSLCNLFDLQKNGNDIVDKQELKDLNVGKSYYVCVAEPEKKPISQIAEIAIPEYIYTITVVDEDGGKKKIAVALEANCAAYASADLWYNNDNGGWTKVTAFSGGRTGECAIGGGADVVVSGGKKILFKITKEGLDAANVPTAPALGYKEVNGLVTFE